MEPVASKDTRPAIAELEAQLAVREMRIAELEGQLRASEALVAELRAEVKALQARMAELEARLGQNSTNSSKPPSSDPPGVMRTPKPSTGRKPGGQPGHKMSRRELVPIEQVDPTFRTSRMWFPVNLRLVV
jgi:transposase